MQKTLKDFLQERVRKDAPSSKSSILMGSNAPADETNKLAGSTTLERCWKSEEIKGNFGFEHDTKTHQIRHLKKSRSLGDELYLDRRAAMENDADDVPYSPEQNSSVTVDSSKCSKGSLSGLHQKAPLSVSVQKSLDQVNSVSIFSVGDSHDLGKESRQCSDSSLTGVNHAPRVAPVIVKSNSMPNIADSVPASERSSPFKYLGLPARSSDDLHVLDMCQKEKSIIEVPKELRQEQEKDDGIHKSENNGYDGYGNSSFTKDWIVPVADRLNSIKFLRVESSVQRFNELPGKHFKTKRIEEWVKDLQHCSPFEESDVVPQYDYDEAQIESTVLNSLAAAKVNVKITPGMEAAQKYVSSLSASATTAQLVNHGLAVIPFLGAFASLRVLNLSGNAIVRITAGALPRGLQTLNLSKNNISRIEGLRKLTRLRVLDLSCNRILRIGRGLASCSSLKELYLAGNKISEVDGLHRLLKLTVLDLRFNKISTAKCLGQLSANYNSLQAIRLEGNPVQKNVGDEHLKKHLLGLLPHLVYFNRQAIRTRSLKDSVDRSVRLVRGLGSDLKGTRKSSHGATAAHKASSSAANHSRRNQIRASENRSKDRNGAANPKRGNARSSLVG